MSTRLTLSGLRSIEECLMHHPERIAKLLIPGGRLSGRFEKMRQMAVDNKIKVEINPKADSDDGVLAILKEYKYREFDELIAELKQKREAGERTVVLALDGIEDPQNLGAILRTAAFMGVAGIVLPRDRATALTDTVFRVASGGVEHLDIAQVTNLSSALEALKEAGFWIVGFSEHAEQSLSDLKCDFDPVLIIGNEEKGIRPLVQKNCDYLVKISGKGKLQSLNASVATALALGWATEIF